MLSLLSTGGTQALACLIAVSTHSGLVLNLRYLRCVQIVLYILIFWIVKFFYLDPQDFLPDSSDLMEDPTDWTFGCSIF